MSVTIKLSDQDAKLIGDVLGVLSDQERRARVRGVADPNTDRLFGSFVRENINRKGSQTFEELGRLGHTFDTAVFANEKGA